MSHDTVLPPDSITVEPMTNYLGNVIGYRYRRVWRTSYWELHISSFAPTKEELPPAAMKRDNTALIIKNTSPFDAEFYINFKELYGDNVYTFNKLNLHIKSFTSSNPEEIAQYQEFVDDTHHAHQTFTTILSSLFPDTPDN